MWYGIECDNIICDHFRANDFTDATDWKTDTYESDTFVEEMDETWRGLKPLYQELHAYVRNKLVKR